MVVFPTLVRPPPIGALPRLLGASVILLHGPGLNQTWTGLMPESTKNPDKAAPDNFIVVPTSGPILERVSSSPGLASRCGRGGIEPQLPEVPDQSTEPVH